MEFIVIIVNEGALSAPLFFVYSDITQKRKVYAKRTTKNFTDSTRL